MTTTKNDVSNRIAKRALSLTASMSHGAAVRLACAEFTPDCKVGQEIDGIPFNHMMALVSTLVINLSI